MGWFGGNGKSGGDDKVFEKIYQELILIRRELQGIRDTLEPEGIDVNRIIDQFEKILKELTV